MNKKLLSVLPMLTFSAFCLAQIVVPPNTVTTNFNSGFYNAPFTLQVNSTNPGDSVLYTLYGSDPRIASGAVTKTTPFTILIDPASGTGRDKTPAVTLRLVKKVNGQFSLPDSRTFIFINSVKTQGDPDGTFWPDPSPINQQVLDYSMDSKVVNDNLYKDSIDDALLQIPSISIITKQSNLTDAATGIYVNPAGEGKAWEREASVELINPDNSQGFQIEAGLRIRGGYSRNTDNPKHAFRLFFRNEYGYGKLKFPLFGSEGTDEFDKIDLRTSQNYSWSFFGDKRGIMLRDIFSRDLQGAMGQPYTRGRFYHLYLNGLYWGIYQTDERPSAEFGETYLGGNKEDYDVVKVETTAGHTIEATDGNLNAWENVWNICQQGFSTNDNYFKLQGLDNSGKRDSTLPVLVDVENLVDYMLLIFYTGNVDAPVSEFLDNDSPNNFYAIRNRNGKKGFKFIAHDSEHSLLVKSGDAGSGINENRVNIGSNGEMAVYSFSKFQPQWLHFKLCSNANYRALFADRVYKHFYNNGAMTVANMQKLFKKRAAEIQTAIIAESARWGDAKSQWSPRTKSTDWLPEVNNVLNNFFSPRRDIVLQQLIDENLFSTLHAVNFIFQNVAIESAVLKTTSGSNLQLSNDNGKGVIYYTFDGSDPRGIDDVISSSAIQTTNNGIFYINTGGVIKARILYNGQWSPLHELNIYIPAQLEKLKITEIHYHPKSNDIATAAKDLEFIELKNTGNVPLNLSGLYFSGGIDYSFPEGTVIQPGALIVLSSQDSVFKANYKFSSFDEYDRNLSDGGDELLLKLANGDTLINVNYLNDSPWPTQANGFGPSIVPTLVNPIGNQNDGTKWVASYAVNGSPGADEPLVNSSADVQNVYAKIYPNPFNDVVVVELSSSSSNEYEVLIQNALGESVQRTLVYGSTAQTLTVNELPQGVYFMSISNLNFKQTTKLVKTY
ncbi:MAG: CotH kinase family protein [Bacteroidetes bacterium]|nr:CotH kinase family protein [Bacteroidota bacterium]